MDVSRIAFSLMMEEPTLSANDALKMVKHDVITVTALVDPADLLRYAAIGLAVLNGESAQSAITNNDI